MKHLFLWNSANNRSRSWRSNFQHSSSGAITYSISSKSFSCSTIYSSSGTDFHTMNSISWPSGGRVSFLDVSLNSIWG